MCIRSRRWAGHHGLSAPAGTTERLYLTNSPAGPLALTTDVRADHGTVALGIPAAWLARSPWANTNSGPSDVMTQALLKKSNDDAFPSQVRSAPSDLVSSDLHCDATVERALAWSENRSVRPTVAPLETSKVMLPGWPLGCAAPVTYVRTVKRRLTIVAVLSAIE